MEVIDYQNPKSWSDKGMTWDASMNPVCVDYVVAIREAMYERINAVNSNINSDTETKIICNFSYVNKFAPIRYLFFSQICGVLRQITPYFVNLDFNDYKEDFSDAPKYWTWRDLNIIEECRICEIPSIGCAATEMISWMIRVKNYINKLLVCKASMKFKTAKGEYTEHCTWFKDAYTEAIRQAKDKYNQAYSSATFRTDHSCGFGSYENNVPVGEEEDEYCSTAGIQTIRDIQNPKSEEMLNFDPVAVLVADTAINQGYPHSWTVMQRIVWNNGGFGVNRGVTIRRFSTGSSWDIMTSTIPTNTMKPKNKPAAYYATSIGMWGNAYFFKDYGVEGGFKFRP